MWHSRVHAAYAVTAVLAAAVAAYVFFWILLARSWAATRPMEDARYGASAQPAGPNNGLTHVLAESSTGKAYYVLRVDESWKRARGADACETAALTQEMAVNRYAQLSPSQKDSTYDALDVLPATLTLKWAEASPDAGGTVQTENGHTYAMVRHYDTRKDCVAAMNAVLWSEVQRQQFAQLMFDVV